MPLLFVNDDAASAECRRCIALVGFARLVVVDGRAGGELPDLDSEPVRSVATGGIAIDGGKHEAVASAAVDRALALEARAGARDHQPFIARALEAQRAR